MLILDLDDTIFKTSSISSDIFKPAIQPIENYFYKKIGKEKTKEMISDMWKIPFDMLAEKYKIPNFLQDEFYQKLDSFDYQLEVKTFDDYPILQKINRRKILVTTGFQKLQNAKIEALGIRSDFEKIYIDDPRDKNRIFKKGIFEKILADENLKPHEVWVIGDNPESELLAAKEVGIPTIQRLKTIHQESKNADFTIHTFYDLEKII